MALDVPSLLMEARFAIEECTRHALHNYNFEIFLGSHDPVIPGYLEMGALDRLLFFKALSTTQDLI